MFLKALAALTLPAALPRRLLADGALRSDPGRLLDLPAGFSYRVVSRVGTTMADGLRVPPAHDGMAAFSGDDGRVILVCNHELPPSHTRHSAFGEDFAALPGNVREKVYDAGGGRTPGAGGTTTTVYNPRTGETEHQFLSLAGTELNCAGGATPWGSWLSCEEVFAGPGTGLSNARLITRERRHGYVFEVPSSATSLVRAEPIRSMGRFEHEACAVHVPTGIVYMTEDRHHSLFYRYLPDVPGELIKGGRLQALAITGTPSARMHNWPGDAPVPVNESLGVHWIDLDDIDPDENDLRLRGAAAGAATFARGEGLAAAGGDFAFSCTIGGPARLGQLFVYTPSPFEGTAREKEAPGSLRLLAEADEESLLRNNDNLTAAPWGDLVVCEDTRSNCGIVGVRPDGAMYAIADNAYSDSELAGVCFSPDGSTLFVNVQYPGTTLAITGPWQELSKAGIQAS